MLADPDPRSGDLRLWVGRQAREPATELSTQGRIRTSVERSSARVESGLKGGVRFQYQGVGAERNPRCWLMVSFSSGFQ
ncbi:hypothetical protein B296_00020676 [Ensete ventricosum]|uniref:Uncharacterized protein n=1 Tax=Ensete ventricosum TaxID=4639 RepID=A0A426YXP5_ENSVE|nr:hypothetical protein B296_00020676 [Ensete ventricosum]